MKVTREMGQRIVNNKRVGGCVRFNYDTVDTSCWVKFKGEDCLKKCVMLDGHPCNFYNGGDDEI